VITYSCGIECWPHLGILVVRRHLRKGSSVLSVKRLRIGSVGGLRAKGEFFIRKRSAKTRLGFFLQLDALIIAALPVQLRTLW